MEIYEKTVEVLAPQVQQLMDFMYFQVRTTVSVHIPKTIVLTYHYIILYMKKYKTKCKIVQCGLKSLLLLVV